MFDDARPAEPGPFLTVRQVDKVFGVGSGALHALSGVDFTVEKGQFISILGASGCGKSTLLMMMAGLESLTGGSITMGGRSTDRPRRDVGVIFQDATLLPWKTALENVLFPIEIFREEMETHRPRAEELLRLVGLGDAMHKKPRQLSGGMRQRVAICRALVHNPAVLLMDEPFSALDAITRDELNVALLDIWERFHQTAIFVTHSIREAVFLSDRVIVLGGRPSTVIADVVIPFDRPRDVTIEETVEFNRICGHLRACIAEGHAARRAPPPATPPAREFHA